MNKNLTNYLISNISDTDVTLDIGCGLHWYHEHIKGKIVTVDAWEEAIPDFVLDVGISRLPFCDNTFDVVLMLDVIEHMTRPNGFFALSEAKRVACGKVVVLTPLFWTSNLQNVVEGPYKGNIYNMHQSQWCRADFDGFSEKPLIEEYFFGEWYK